MNTKMMLLVAAGTLACLNGKAQTQDYEEPVEYKVSKIPVTSEAQIKDNLFGLGPEEPNYYFRVNLPNDNFLIAEFNKISYWQADGSLVAAVASAASTVNAVSDSFKQVTASKRVDIHIPKAGKPLTVRMNEHTTDARIVMLSDKTGPLKIGMDTISVVKTYREVKQKNETELVRVKYTFILKDLDDVQNIADNNALIIDIEKTLDSLVQRKRRQWIADDSWFHAMRAEYSPMEKDAKKRFQREMTSTARNAFDLSVSIGTSLMINSLAANTDIGVGYRWKDKRMPDMFQRLYLSLNTVAFPEPISTGVSVKGMMLANLEYGILFRKSQHTVIPAHEVSIGLGYKIYNDPGSLFSANILRVSFNYSVNNLLTISPEYYFAKYNELTGAGGGFVALTLKLRFLNFNNK